MKPHLVCILLAIFLHAARAEETNLVTFTNRTGEVFTNVRISGANASSLFVWTTNGAGRMVPLATAPEFLQRQYKYEPSAAFAFDQRTKDFKETSTANYAAEVKRLQDRAATAALRRKTKFWIEGKVLQRTAAGLLITPKPTIYVPAGEGYRVLCLLTDYRNESLVADGDSIRVEAWPTGQYNYTAVSGGSKTVRKFSTDPSNLVPPTGEELAVMRVATEQSF